MQCNPPEAYVLTEVALGSCGALLKLGKGCMSHHWERRSI